MLCMAAQANGAMRSGMTEGVLLSFAPYSQLEDTTIARTRSGRIYFRVDDVNPESDYTRDHNAALDSLLSSVGTATSDSLLLILNITVSGYASPEGTYAHNQELARRRADNVADALMRSGDIKAGQITVLWTAEDWEGVRGYVAEARMPEAERDSVLAVIDSDAEPDSKLEQIRTAWPALYRQALEQCFPLLRRVDWTVTYMSRPRRQDMPPVTIPAQQTFAEAPALPASLLPLPERQTVREHMQRSPWIAVKNNLLYDAALAPNIEIERWFGRGNRYSIMAEYQFPWYTWHHNSRAYEIQNLGLEGRYWLNAARVGRKWLTGFFAGVYVMTGKYDLERNSHGHQGEYWSTGLTAGYAHSIGRWNMEYSLGIGYLDTDYRCYRGQFSDHHLIWQHDGHTGYFGPTKLKVSLVYLLGGYGRKGGRR